MIRWALWGWLQVAWMVLAPLVIAVAIARWYARPSAPIEWVDG